MSGSNSKAVKRNMRKMSIALTIVLLGIISSIVFIKRDVVADAITLATTHQPEAFTELSFNDSTHLPIYSPVHKIEHVVFHIANHEAKTIDYVYTVKQDALQITHTSITLQDGQSVDVPFTYVISTPSTATQISVQLDGRSEHIDFRSNS